MRRAASFLFAFLIIICMALPVRADSGATAMDLRAAVDESGACQVTILLSLHLDTPQEELRFPVPASAYDIKVNGVKPSTSRRGQTLVLDLGGILGTVAGDYSVSITYSLPDVVDDQGDEGSLLLEVPLLCGFSLPIESFSYTVMLPGDVGTRPTLTSTYYQTRIEENATLSVDGAQIQGNVYTRILGSDWLTLSLKVNEEMFPQKKPLVLSMNLPEIAMIVCALLALIYWLVFLRCLPPRVLRRTTAPDGITAGDLGAALTMTAPDLTMLVIQWAQLGYILIQLDNGGRVLLHRRMMMGNERSLYETRIFRSLFGGRGVIDCSGARYAALARKVAAGKPGVPGLFQRGSGNPLVFRALAALVGVFGGVSLGSALGDGTALKELLAVLLGGAGLVSSWLIQEGCRFLHLRRKTPVWLSLALCAGWLVLGLCTTVPVIAFCVVPAQLLAGLAAAYGGRRTDLGKQAASQILGLRRFMKTASKEELARILRTNPEFFYTLVPYALAMGVDTKFAKAFGGIRMPACPYLTSGMDGHMTALEWSRKFRDVLAVLDERQLQLLLDRLTGR